MSKKKKNLLIIISLTSALLIFSLCLPSIAFADDPSLPSPIGEINVIELMLRVMQIALAVVDIFALFMFILGGFEFLISAGNPTMIKKAKDTLIWATLGILVITLSYTILKFIFEEVSKGFGS
jgi:hypothetical protein